ncbi:uncharacterized protein I206_103388 [Kwoniella pini CBS 10737]|uniref:Uncharacterized protein n=1 Tax=Kwoniella pini CBS 10737 TaxID=1296096 RepID=A0AAJ8L3C9_9TREE
MAPRSTRASATAIATAQDAEIETPGSKRKRRSSQDSPLKVVLPSPSAIAKANPSTPTSTITSISTEKVNGETDHDSKRQKLSLKIHLHAAEKPREEVKVEEDIPGALSKEIREGLSVVIARICPEATVTYMGKASARAQFHLPVPPLPSHFPSHSIYNFCASLYSLLLEVEPQGSGEGLSAERWALIQKTPQAGEWFTGAADAREVQKRKAKEASGNLLEKLAENGDAFGESLRMISELTR